MTGTYTGADLFVDAIDQYGVEHVFGNPGTTELPVVRAIATGDTDVEYVLGLHEDIAVGMAAGYACTRRYHGDVNPVGVVNLHVTPGLAHGLGNLYGASWTGAPLVVTAGNHERDFRHEEPLLSGDLGRLAEQFCKWSDEVLDVRALPTMLRRAFRVAMTPPTGPVFLALPLDTMRSETDPGEIEPLGAIPNAGSGDPTQLERATDLLVDADEPVLVVGDHVARSGADAVGAAVDFAEACGARVHAEILACEVDFPGDHDQWTGHIPPDEATAARLMDTDTLVFAGCSTNTTLLRHEGDLVDPGTTCIHVSDDDWELGKNQPADAAIVGDPGLVLADLAGRLADRLPDDVREDRLAAVRAARESIADTRNREGNGDDAKGDGQGERGDGSRASKEQLVDAMREAAPDAYIVDEGVTAKYALLTRWPFEPEGLISNKGGGLGYGLPASVGAALAESGREEPRDVLGFVADGSYLYYPHALYSAARQDLDLTVVVPDNRNYRILKDNADRLFGEGGGDDLVGVDFDPPVDIPGNAESHGARGHLVESPDEIAPAVESAIDSDGPDVLDVLVHD